MTTVKAMRRRGGGTGSTIRVLVAIESTRDRALLPALQRAAPVPGGAFLVSRRCMTAQQLEAAVHEEQADAVLIGEGLFGLDAATLACCTAANLPTVVLGAAPTASGHGILELPAETAPEQVCAVLAAAVWGSGDQLVELLEATGSQTARLSAGQTRGAGSDDGPAGPVRHAQVITLVGPPHGQVGTTRASIELAAASERHTTVLLLDAVLDEPSVAAALGLNPARNLTVLAANAADTTSPERWVRLLREEVQPLDTRHCPRAAVLAGVPGPALRHRLDPTFLIGLVRHAAGPGGFGTILVDAGAEPPPGTLESACWWTLVELADRVLVLALPDLVSLRRARGTFERLEGRVHPDRLGIVLNRYRRGQHDDAADIAIVLGAMPLVAVVPEDVRACTQALRLQQPLLGLGRSAAARELRRLAEQLRRTAAPASGPARPSRRSWWPWRRR